jgi:hypothetical protein
LLQLREVPPLVQTAVCKHSLVIFLVWSPTENKHSFSPPIYLVHLYLFGLLNTKVHLVFCFCFYGTVARAFGLDFFFHESTIWGPDFKALRIWNFFSVFVKLFALFNETWTMGYRGDKKEFEDLKLWCNSIHRYQGQLFMS